MNDAIKVSRGAAAAGGQIATVTIDRPDKLNAIDTAAWRGLGAAFAELDADETLRCVILTGAGQRAFCVGADISEFEQTRATAEKARAYAELAHPALAAIQGCRHPVLAAIRGLCVGGGLELALCADLRICGTGSRFGIPAKRLGLVVAYNELMPLLHQVSKADALEILLEGEFFDAARAERMRLVNRVVADDAVMDEAVALAERIADGAPLTARWHKSFVNRLMDPAPLTEAEQAECYACFDTEDFRAGYQAFLAKQKPVFRGR